MSIRVCTPCKVNLHLGIHAEKDARGYHRVDSVMLPVALFDDVVVEEAPELQVVHEPALGVPPEKTTVWKAATLLAAALGTEPRVRIRVTARIPEKAGLGGSSADAGATLRALAQLWGADALDPRVVAVARRVGADVAFFLDPVPSLYLGAGDVLAEKFDELVLPVALAMPPCGGVSTKECYDEFDCMAQEPAPYDAVCEALRAGNAQAVAASIYNNLAPAAVRLNPPVGEAAAWLAAQPEVVSSQVTGSGACSFGIFGSLEEAQAVASRAAQAHGWWSFAALTVGTPR